MSALHDLGPGNRMALLRSRMTKDFSPAPTPEPAQCCGVVGPTYDPVPERCSLEEGHEGGCV